MPAEHILQKRWYIGYLICILCFALVIWSFYPGMMSPDSIANLTDGRRGSFADINAPLMSYIWGWLDTISAGPGLMFVLQNVVFWGACALLWRTTNVESLALGTAVVLFGLMPHILAQTAVVWKDIGMGASLLMTVALLFYAKRTGSKIALLVTPVFLFYAYAARLNAFPAVLPVAVWAGFVALRVFEIKGKKLAAASLGVGYFILLSVAVYGVNQRITEGRTVYPFQQVYLYDLAALSAGENEAIFPDYVKSAENFSLDGVRARYNTRSVSDLIYPDLPNPDDKPVLKLTDRPDEVAALKSKWWEAISADPVAYLEHRGRVFAQLTGLSRAVTAPFWEQGFSSSPPEFRPEENAGTWVLTKYFGAFRRPFPQTFFFRSFVWLILCGFFLYKAVRRGLRDDWDLVFVLSLSSLLFTFAYFPTTPSTEFRYLFWPAIASALTVIFGIYLLRREKRPGSAGQDLPV
jgi:hypothetical protein